MSVVLSKHTLPELESLLIEVKREIAERENVVAPTEASPSESDVQTGGIPPSTGALPEAPETATAPAVEPLAVEPLAVEPLAVEPPVVETPASEQPTPSPVSEPAPAPAIRYVHPASRTLTWTGEGDMPEWISAYLAHGGSWSAMENAAEKLAASHRLSTRLSPTNAAQRTRK